MRWLAPLVLLVAACSGHPSESDCAKVVDHMIEIMTAPPLGEDGAVAKEAASASEAWKKAFRAKDPSRDAMIDTCRTKMSGSHVSCVLEARDEAALARCFGG